MSVLSSQRWRAASPYLDEGLELPPSERHAWLAALEKRDPAIAVDLRALLEDHEALDACGFLEAGAGLLTADGVDASATTLPAGRERPGTAFGAYRLVRELGTGGMGVVWLAQQEHPIRRLVAVKVVRPGADSKQVLSRFEAERQALAIAYAHTGADRSRYSLNLVSPLGGPPHRLLTNSTPIGGPTWTPDGRALVIEILRQPKRLSELWAISVDTGKRRQLTSPPEGIVGDIAPVISPDGKTLAFCRKTAWRTADLYLLDLQPDLTPAGHPRRLTDLGYVDRPAWTPDGARILFEAAGEGAGIWQVDPTSKRVRPVFGPPDTATQPAIARRPGGHSSLIFTNEVAEGSIWRYSTRQGPGGPRVELVPSSRSQSLARYSNDGNRLAFSSTRSGHQEIWVANADGSQPIQLTALRHQLTEMGHWSPADDVIAFVSQGRGPRQIYVIGSSGGPAVPVTSEDGVDFGSGWSRDGSAYYYTSSRSGRREVWKVSRTGGRPEQVTENGGENGFDSTRGIFNYWRQQPGQGSSLMRRMPDGDREVPLFPEGSPQSLTVSSPEGFYYKAAGTHDVYLYNERTGRSSRVLDLPARPFNQFTISPDGRWFASTFLQKSSVDLMIMEHFK